MLYIILEEYAKKTKMTRAKILECISKGYIEDYLYDDNNQALIAAWIEKVDLRRRPKSMMT